MATESHEELPVCYTLLKSEAFSLIIINDTAQCEDTDHINEFSIIIITHSELLLYKIGYYTQLNELCYI